MQDPSTFQHMKPQFPEQEHVKCPRCDSSNTKFCYYNNYNLSQPRHFCKGCRRYWTKGGTLRNIPVGGGTRKNAKRPSNTKRRNPDPEPLRNNQIRRTLEPSPPSSPRSVSGSTVQNSASDPYPTRMYNMSAEPGRKIMDVTGSFSSFLATSSQFGSVLDANGSAPKMVQLGDLTEDLNAAYSGLNTGPGLNQVLDEQENNNNGPESYLLQSGESSFWGGNVWSDLDIYTPGSSFQ